MRTSLLLAVLLFTACTDDSTDSTGTLPGPTVAKELCSIGCSDALRAQIENLEFRPVVPQVSQPGDDPVFFLQDSNDPNDPCTLDGACQYTCREARTADTCQLLHCALTDGRLLIGRTCR